ncbi:MAG TPA: hypothetical protein VGI82_08420 [Chitinophagaceae bacterium]
MSSLINLGDYRNHDLYHKEADMRKDFHSMCDILQNELGKRVMMAMHLFSLTGHVHT